MVESCRKSLLSKKQLLMLSLLNRRHLPRIYDIRITKFTTEEWRDIPRHSKHQVSSHGNVKNKQTNKLRFINYDRFKKLHHPVQCTIRDDYAHAMTHTVSRLVLSCFDPRHEQHELCASHIDRDQYNNRLCNLQWIKRKNLVTNYKGTKTCAVTLTTKSKQIDFISTHKCLGFLASLDIVISYGSVTRWCRNQEMRHGFQFAYTDKSKYHHVVIDIETEKWKEYQFVKTIQKRKYYVSSLGRLKNAISGKEMLIPTNVFNGYQKVKFADQSCFVHRVVAKAFIDNPMSHNVVDHIDGNRQNNAASNLRWVASYKHNRVFHLRAVTVRKNRSS